MNSLERRMVEILKNLKENNHVIGVKAEFEAEGTRLEEAMRLKEVLSYAGLDLTIKIGGCEALKDMYDARSIGVRYIVAPMIESAFALQKFLKAARIVFPGEEGNEVSLMINIETVTACKNLPSMLESPFLKGLHGIVIGRGDLSESLGHDRDYINSNEVLEYSGRILKESKEKKLICGMGGGVSGDSIAFFNKLPTGTLDFFETRKVQFKCPEVFEYEKSREGILKAVGFELMWLKNKQNYYAGISNEDAQRIKTLEAKYKDSIIKAGGKTE